MARTTSGPQVTRHNLEVLVRTSTHHDLEIALPTIPDLDQMDSVSLVLNLPTREGRPAQQTIRLNYRMVMAMADLARGGW